MIPELGHLILADGTELYYRLFPGRGAARCLAVYVHGIQSHGGWCEVSGRRWAELGMDVVLVDRRGSGRSQGARGDCRSFEQLVDDHEQVVEHFLRARGHGRVVLLAHSWGAQVGVALAHRWRRDSRLAALALLTPTLTVTPSIPQALKFVAKNLHRSSHCIDIAGGTQRLTDNPEALARIEADELRLEEVTIRFARETIRAKLWSMYRVPRLSCPVFCALAHRDVIADNAAQERLLRKIRAPMTLRFYDAKHTIEFEPAIAEVHRDLAEFFAREVSELRSTRADLA